MTAARSGDPQWRHSVIGGCITHDIKRLRWAGRVAQRGETRNVCKALVGKPEWKRPLSSREWVVG